MPIGGFEMPSLKTFVETDLVERYSTSLPALLIQATFGLTCTALAIIGRIGVDMFAPGAGPFALIYPVTLISTLFGRWQSGLITLALSFLWVWYFVLSSAQSYASANPDDAHRAIVNACSAGLVLVLAEMFRHGVQSASRQRDVEISRRDTLLKELDHRTKNNFMIVTSLLQLQMRQLKSKEAKEAFGAAASRVHSIAAAHEYLYAHRDELNSDEMPVKEYLHSLANSIFSGLFTEDTVELDLSIDETVLQRDQVVAIGMVLNEIMTNAAKHAFAPGQPGTISVEFRTNPSSWNLIVSDSGRGMDAEVGSPGLGTSLIQAFATKAGAEVATEQLHPGTRVTIVGAVAS